MVAECGDTHAELTAIVRNLAYVGTEPRAILSRLRESMRVLVEVTTANDDVTLPYRNATSVAARVLRTLQVRAALVTTAALIVSYFPPSEDVLRVKTVLSAVR